MQTWAVIVFGRNCCPLHSLAQSHAVLQAPGRVKDRGRAGGKSLPSGLSPSGLESWLVPQAECCPPTPAQPVCHLWLGSQAGLRWWCTSSVSLLEGGASYLKSGIPDRRLLLEPCCLYKLPCLWFYSAACIVEVLRVMFYPIWSKLTYLHMHQRG